MSDKHMRELPKFRFCCYEVPLGKLQIEDDEEDDNRNTIKRNNNLMLSPTTESGIVSGCPIVEILAGHAQHRCQNLPPA